MVDGECTPRSTGHFGSSHFGSRPFSLQVVVAHARRQVSVFFWHLVKTWSHAAQRLGCVRIRRLDQDSPWESATGRAVASRAEADHSRQPGVEGPLAASKGGLEAALTRVRAQLKPKPRVSNSQRGNRLIDFGQFDLANFWMLNGALEGWSPEGWSPEG